MYILPIFHCRGSRNNRVCVLTCRDCLQSWRLQWSAFSLKVFVILLCLSAYSGKGTGFLSPGKLAGFAQNLWNNKSHVAAGVYTVWILYYWSTTMHLETDVFPCRIIVILFDIFQTISAWFAMQRTPPRYSLFLSADNVSMKMRLSTFHCQALLSENCNPTWNSYTPNARSYPSTSDDVELGFSFHQEINIMKRHRRYYYYVIIWPCSFVQACFNGEKYCVRF